VEPLQYEAICKYVGKLFLESNSQLESQSAFFHAKMQELREQVKKLEQERDEALRLIATTKRE